MGKNFNIQSLVEFFCLCVFSISMLYLLISGTYLSYVTPKMAPYLCFCAIVMMLWAVSKLTEIFRRQHKLRFTHCLVLIIPILFILLPHNSVGTIGFSALKFEEGVSGDALTAAMYRDKTKPQDSAAISGSVQAKGVSTTPSVTPEKAIASVDLKEKFNLRFEADGSIAVTHEKYYEWLTEIFSNMQKYEGVKISIMGFVFKEPSTMKENQFVPARLLMSCCSADLVPCGIISVYDKAPQLREGTWVTVTGIIHIGEYRGKKEPQISVLSVSEADKPLKEYVYPID